jgi:hypothetical protein
MGGAMRLPVLSKWNERLSALAAMGQRIRPGSTVLQLNLDYPEPLDPENPHGVIPYLHAVDLLSTRGFIDLRNYEASMSYFTVKFRPDVSPFPGLGALYDMEATPPIFDIIRYEKETRGRVDYLLFQGGAVFDKHTGRGLEDKLYRDRIAAFTLVASGEGGNLRLYERAPSGLSR